MNKQPLTMEQAADYCGRSYEGFRFYINEKRGPNFTLFGKRKMFTQEDLDNWKPEDRRNQNGKHFKPKRKYQD